MMHHGEPKFMALAIKLAEENLTHKRGGPFGAVVIKDGKVIGTGVNTVIATNDPSAHAEINAIRDACKTISNYQLHDCEIYSSCEPCPMCLGAIYWSRPARVFFAAGRLDANHAGFDDAFIYNEFNVPFNDRTIPMYQLMQQDAIDVFNRWLELDLKIKY